jgi:hypothetical protein
MNTQGRMTAEQICAQAKLDDAAQSLLAPSMTPAQFVAKLGERQMHAEGITVMAHALPMRQAIWWGALCVWRSTDSQLSRLKPAEVGALRAAVAWALQPSEENRRAAQKAAETAQPSTPAGCLAMAAFFSAGSMTEQALPMVPVPPFATAQAVAVAILLAATRNGGRKANGYRQRFLELGTLIANGRFRWDDPAVQPRP